MPTYAVEGMQNTMRALKTAERDVRLGVRKELREAAEPVARTAETLALARIRRMRRSSQWAAMRVGVTQKLVYVAPRERGIKAGGHPLKRPKMAPLMLARAMEPALTHHQAQVTRELDQMLDQMAARFNRSI